MPKNLIILLAMFVFSGAAMAQNQGSGGSQDHPVNDPPMVAGGGVEGDPEKGGGAEVAVNPGGQPTVIAGGGQAGQQQRVPISP